MALSEPGNSRPSLAALTPHDLLHIFGYLNFEDLLQCRLVCPHWYQIIKHDHRLIDRFRFGVTLNAGTVISMNEPPFSIIEKSQIKLKRITIKDDFLESGNSITVVEANRLKLLELSEMLRNKKVANTVTEMTVHACDDEPRTNALLFQLIMEMKSLRVLRFTITAFVHCLEAMRNTMVEKRESLELVEVMHPDFKRLASTDFQHLLHVFPNVKRIDITPYHVMLLGEDILENLAHLIKSIEKLEAYTLVEVANVENMFLQHFSYECYADVHEDVTSLQHFINAHPEIQTMSLKVLNCTRQFFNQPMEQLTDLELSLKKTDDSEHSESVDEDMKLCNILQRTPNLTKMSVRYKGQHEFGHQIVPLNNLTDVTLRRYPLECETCFTSLLKSMANVRTLALVRHGQITLKQLTLVSTHLQHLHSLQLMFEDSVDLQNDFAQWPAMPKLKTLIVNRVGYLMIQGIETLKKSCPLLEVIKFYSLRGVMMADLLKVTFTTFPNLQTVTFRGGRWYNISHLNYITGNVGCRLRELDISAYIEPAAIISLFQNNNFLETVRCKYGSLVVTRRIYYEVAILKAYSLEEVQQPLQNRKRLHMYDDMFSDSETSGSEVSSSGSSYETITDDDDDDNNDDEE